MKRHASRLDRLVQVARRREEQARQSVAVARAAERAAVEHVDAVQSALRATTATGADLHLAFALHRLGRNELDRACAATGDAARETGERIDTWRGTHQRLGTLERLDERLREAFLVELRRREQQEADELATTRHRSHP